MVWSKTSPHDGKTRYIKREGDNIVLTKEKRGRLLSEIPQGWDVRVISGRLKLVRVR